MPNRNLITLVPDAASYPAVQAFLEEQLDEAGVSMRLQSRVQVAADEIWSNIVHYSGASEATLELALTGERLLLTFTDDGRPYDPTVVPPPDTTLPADERRIGGLGLHMVRSMTAAMRYHYSGSRNCLALEFALS